MNSRIFIGFGKTIEQNRDLMTLDSCAIRDCCPTKGLPGAVGQLLLFHLYRLPFSVTCSHLQRCVAHTGLCAWR